VNKNPRKSVSSTAGKRTTNINVQPIFNKIGAANIASNSGCGRSSGGNTPVWSKNSKPTDEIQENAAAQLPKTG
jgi:hypothetical protein